MDVISLSQNKEDNITEERLYPLYSVPMSNCLFIRVLKVTRVIITLKVNSREYHTEVSVLVAKHQHRDYRQEISCV